MKVSDINAEMPEDTKREMNEWLAKKFGGYPDWAFEPHSSHGCPDYFTIDAALALCEKLGVYVEVGIRGDGGGYCKATIWVDGDEQEWTDWFNSLSDLAPAIIRCALRSMDIKSLEV